MTRSCDYSDSVIVTYDCHETPEQIKRRLILKLPKPQYSFTVERIDDAQQSQHPVSRNQKAGDR